MLDEKLQHQLYEIIAIDKGLLEQDETRVELWERLSELRDDVSATIDKRYGDLFRLLVAADMIDFDYFEGENGYFSLSPSSYLGPYNGNSLSFVKDGEGASRNERAVLRSVQRRGVGRKVAAERRDDKCHK